MTDLVRPYTVTELALLLAEAWYAWRHVARNRLPDESKHGWERRERAQRRKFDRAANAYAAYRDAEATA